MVEMLEAITALSATEFENLTYDCLRAIGLKNLVWRTPGSDGGRDIEGLAYSRDLSGHENVQKWYVECKRYSTSLDWPTIWQKIAYADVQKADVLLVSTNSNPSPQCETQVSEWNSNRRRPIIRFWRGYDFPRLLRTYWSVASTYGLIVPGFNIEVSAFDLAFLITKITQAAYVGIELGNGAFALEAAASLSELLSQRLDDLSKFGRLVPAVRAVIPPSLDWAYIGGSTDQWEDASIRALLAFLRYQLNARSLRVTFDGPEATIIGVDAKLKVTGHALEQLQIVAHWARAEVRPDTSVSTTFHVHQRTN